MSSISFRKSFGKIGDRERRGRARFFDAITRTHPKAEWIMDIGSNGLYLVLDRGRGCANGSRQDEMQRSNGYSTR